MQTAVLLSELLIYELGLFFLHALLLYATPKIDYLYTFFQQYSIQLWELNALLDTMLSEKKHFDLQSRDTVIIGQIVGRKSAKSLTWKKWLEFLK
jgi:hypothetical protein